MDYRRCQRLTGFPINLSIEADIPKYDSHADIYAGLDFSRINVLGLLKLLNASLEVLIFLHLHNPVRQEPIVARTLIKAPFS